MFPENLLPVESIPMPQYPNTAYYDANLCDTIAEYYGRPDDFKALRLASRWLPTEHSPMLRVIINTDQSPYLKTGYELGLVPCSRFVNDMPVGTLVFNPDLTQMLINDGTRRQHGKIRFGGVKHDGADCFRLAKKEVVPYLVSTYQLLPTAPPPDRGENECPICKSDMGAETRFTCRNGHQTHLTCWNDWTRSALRDKTLCVVCRCPTGTDAQPHTHIRTEFHLKGRTHKDADLLALNVFRINFISRGGLTGQALGDTLYRYKTEHHLTEWRSGNDEDPDMRGVIISTSIHRPYWRDFLTYFRSPENISHLLGLRVITYHYPEPEFLADLNRANPLDVAMRMLTENAEESKRSSLKWRVYVEQRVLTKTNEEVIEEIRRLLNLMKDQGGNGPFHRQTINLPVVPVPVPVVVERPVVDMPMV